MNNLNIRKNIFLSLIIVLSFFALNTQSVFSQSLGATVDNKNKLIVENPFGYPGNAEQVTESSCPNGSVLVGFNIYNAGGSFGHTGSLYCKSISSSLGNVSAITKYVVENPWGGPGNDTEIVNSSCEFGSVLVGFNIHNAGGNTGATASLYCAKVPELKLLPVVAYTRTVVESPNWLAKPANQDQISSSSCPDGSVLVGFNLLNMGDNYSFVGALYCRQVRVFTYDISAADIVSLSQGATGSSNVITTSGPSTTFTSKYNGYCKITDDRAKLVYVPKLPATVTFYIDCVNSSPNFDPGSQYNKDTFKYDFIMGQKVGRFYWTGESSFGGYYYSMNDFLDEVGWNRLSVITYGYAGSWCGGKDESQVYFRWGSDIQNFVCKKPVTDILPPITEPVTLTLTKILNTKGDDVLRKTDGTGIQFVSFVPSSVTPSAPAILNVKADANVSAGTYVATVVSNTSDNAAVDMRMTTFKITVTTDLPTDPYNLSITSSGNSCTYSDLKLTATWDVVSGATGYNIYRTVDNKTFTKINQSPIAQQLSDKKVSYIDKTGTPGIVYGYKVVAVIDGKEQEHPKKIISEVYPIHFDKDSNECKKIPPPPTGGNPNPGTDPKKDEPKTTVVPYLYIEAKETNLELNKVSQEKKTEGVISYIGETPVSGIIPTLKIKAGKTFTLTASVGPKSGYTSCVLSNDKFYDKWTGTDKLKTIPNSSYAVDEIKQIPPVVTYTVQCGADIVNVNVQIIDTNIKEK